MPGSTRHPCTDDYFVSGAEWIAGQARNDSAGCHAGLDPASMQPSTHAYSKAWGGGLSQKKRD